MKNPITGIVDEFFSAASPDATFDSTRGYRPGSIIVNQVSQDSHICISATPGAAVWLSQRFKTLNGASALTDVVSVSGFNTTGDGSFFARQSATDLITTATYTDALMFVASTPLADEQLAGKGNGGSSGRAFIQRASGTYGQLRFQSAGDDIFWNYRAEDIGKVFLAVVVANPTEVVLRIYGGTRLEATLGVGDAQRAASSISTSSGGFCIGGLQAGSSGTISSGATTAKIIGYGHSTTALDLAQVNTLMTAAVAQGTVPADANFPGAVAVYQAVNGLENDQVGSFDLTKVEDGGALTEETTTPVYAGSDMLFFDFIGQSLVVGQEAAGTVGGVDYTVPTSVARMAIWPDTTFEDLDDSGAATGTGPWISAMRQFAADGVVLPQGAVYAAGGTDLATDWSAGGAQNTAHTAYIEDLKANTIDRLRFMATYWGQGEADGDNATDAAAYQANEDAFFDDRLAMYAANGVVDSNFKWLNRLIGDHQTAVSERATVNAGKTANATSRSDVLLITPSGLVTIGDNLHDRFASTVGSGLGGAAAYNTNANAIATEPA